MINLSNKQKILILVGYTAAAVVVGRYLAPEKIKIETKTVEVATHSQDNIKDVIKNTDKKVTTTEDIKPTGEKITTVVVENNTTTGSKVEKDTIDSTSKIEQTSKEITKSSSKLNLSVLGGVDVTNPGKGLVIGGSINRNLIGPITVGIWGLNNGNVGASIGLTF